MATYFHGGNVCQVAESDLTMIPKTIIFIIFFSLIIKEKITNYMALRDLRGGDQ